MLSFFPLSAAALGFSLFYLLKKHVFDEQHEIVFYVASNAGILVLSVFWAVIVMRRTDQKLLQTQRSLQQSHDLLHRITDNIPGVVYRYRRFKDGKQTFDFMSNGAEKLFGYTRAQIVENFDLVWNRALPEEVPRLIESIQTSLASMSVWSHEFRVYKADGTVIWIR